MSRHQPRSNHVERLRRFWAARDASSKAIPAAEGLAGPWPAGCEAFPASYAQKRLWFLHQLEPGLSAYQLPAVWRLRGDLDVEALEQAFAGLIERHGTLRSSFQMVEGEVLQIVHPPEGFALSVEALADGDGEEAIAEWQKQERSSPLDLSSGVLLRARLLRVAAGEHLLLLNHHHIASDGWSISVVERDLVELYNAHHGKRSPHLQRLAVHYQDYAVWQRERLGGSRLQKLREYWISQLTGLQPLELPTDRPRPATPSYRGDSVSFQIEPALLEPFEAFCGSEGATLQMGLLALLALLLHRYSHQEDFAIAIPIWGRNHPDLEALIGFFVNTLPIRTRFDPEHSFRQLLRQVKATSIAAYDRQELPFEQMVEALNLERDASRNPLLQVMLQLIELPEAGLEQLDGLAVQSLPSRSDSAKLDLSFDLCRSADQGLSASITYATDLFDADRIERLSSHLITLLSSVVQAPDQPAAALNLLPEPERQLIESWQQGPSIEVPELCMHQLFEQQVERTPEAIALVFGEQKLTYSELNARANQLAHHLIELGVGPELIVAVCLERSFELIVALLAILKAGGAYLPLDPIYTSQRLRETLQDSNSAFVLTDRTGRHSLDVQDEALQVIPMDQPAAWESQSGQNLANVAVGVNHLAYVIYTSGSTGKPKGVMVEHAGVARLLSTTHSWYSFENKDCWSLFHSFGFDFSVWEIWGALAYGARLVIVPRDVAQSPRAFYKLICDQGITILNQTPAAFVQLISIQSDDGRGHALRHVIIGGEALELRSLRPWMDREGNRKTQLNNMYGITETTVHATCKLLASPAEGRTSSSPIGRPLPDLGIYILDTRLNPVPIGVAGEIYVSGPGVARGYLNRPDLTRERFICNPFSKRSDDRLYKTGDLAYWLPNGEIEYLGRNDSQIKLRGFRIEPGEITSHLLAHPAVAQAVVVLCREEPANPRLIAYWVPQDALPLGPEHAVDGAAPAAAGGVAVRPATEHLRAFLAERLPDYMVPSAFVALEALPLTANGKLDRKALPAPSFAGDLHQRIAPSTDLERQLHTLWAEVLGHDEFGISDNFFYVGGHSLAAARLVSRIEQSLGSALPLAALFQNPTIGGLAPLLVDSSGVAQFSAAMLPAAPLSGDWPPGCEAYQASFAQARLWFLHQLEPELTAYHLPAVWRLSGDLDISALQRALEGLIERHSTLRTSFLLQGSEVTQIVLPAAPFALTGEALGERDADEVIQEWLEEESRTPFDLMAGQLLRARLLAVDGLEHVLLINHHHIASDGWSLLVLVHDLEELYNAHHAGRSPALPQLPVLYQDYAAWQRQRLSGGRLVELQNYWMGQLQHLESLELPSDRARPAMPSHRGGSVGFTIEPALLEPFEELCRREGATLQMGLLAVVALLLHRYSRQDDFAIGVPIWGRNHPDLENLIGFFINTLPIRTRFEPDQSFCELLAQVRATSIAAYDHQELPFEQMVEALNLDRDTSRHPLVQVMLQLIELPEESLGGFSELQVDTLPVQSDSSRFDLEFFLRRTGNHGIQVDLIYASDLFAADRIERLSTHLITLLGSVLQGPDAPADTLNLLPGPERQLIEGWQWGPTLDVPDLCVHQLFEQQVQRTPDAMALIFQEHQLSYAQLNGRANQLAHHLIELGVGAEVIVAVCLQRSVELVVSLLAILKAGGAYLPLDPAWPQERRELMMTEAGCNVLIHQEGAEIINAALPAHVTDAASASSLAYISYTSGSTGVPKGVAITHQAILRLVDSVNGFHLVEGTAVLQLAPVAFDAATFEIWGALLNGGTLVLAPPGQLSLPQLAALLRRRRIATLWLTAGLFHAMVEAELDALAGVRQVLAGGDVLSPEHVQRLLASFPPGHELINGYGPTENTTFTCCQLMVAGDTVDPARVSIGRPIAMTVVRVLDPSGHTCPIGIAGELHIGGTGLARGYLNNRELTNEKFILDPFAGDGSARLYKSGDLASWNPDGTLAFHGRIDEQIKLRGFRIEPGEIEANLLRHPAVAQASLVLRLDDPANPRLIAYWVRKPLDPDLDPDDSASVVSSATSEELRSSLGGRLPDYMVPTLFVELEALPLTPNGKLDRRALPAPSFCGDLEQRVAPSTEQERQLHALWVEVLGHEDFGIRDNFFFIGGHSLAAARLISRIEQALGSAPPLAALFQSPTIAGLLPLVVASSGAFGSSSASSKAIPTAEALPGKWPAGCQAFPASYAQKRLWFLHQLEPGLSAYQLPAVWRLRGDLEVEALEQAFAGLIERHGTLRSSFQMVEGEVLQIVHPPLRFALSAEALPDRDGEEALAEWLRQERSNPLDLTSGVLLRARLLRLAEGEHLLLLNHHHIASDGWSQNLLQQELAALYQAARRCGGKGSTPLAAPLPALPVSYADFSVWQRQALSGERRRQLVDYWSQQLGDLAPLDLVSDHPRPAVLSYRGQQLAFELAPPAIKGFDRLCHSHGATLQMGLLALVAVLLQRYSRSDDIAIAVPHWGRSHPDLEGLIGFFINTLVLRCDLSGEPSFLELLGRVRATSLAAYAQQSLPFEEVVEALQPERDRSRHPLTGVLVQLLDVPDSGSFRLDGLQVHQEQLKSEQVRFDLEILARRQGAGLVVDIFYATDLFDKERIEQLAGHLGRLLDGVLVDAERPIGMLPMLSPAEQRQLQDWNATGRDYSLPLRLQLLIERQVARTPDATAVEFEDLRLSYLELNQRSNRLARLLRQRGVGPGVLVGICVERSLEMVVALLAILKAGGAYVPLDPSYPTQRLSDMLEDAQVSLILSQEQQLSRLPVAAAEVILLDPTEAHCGDQLADDLDDIGCDNDLAYVIFTSGSTGRPKGAMNEHCAVCNRLLWMQEAYGLTPDDRVLQKTPLGFDVSVWELFWPLISGARLVIARPDGHRDSRYLVSLIRSRAISTLHFVPSMLRLFLGTDGARQCSSIKRLICSGEVLDVDLQNDCLQQLPGAELHNLYGPTEAAIDVCFWRCLADERVGTVPIGKPVANTQIHILDRYRQPVPMGAPGEIYIGGVQVGRGYINRDTLTVERFLADPFSLLPGARLYRTGDLGRQRSDGAVEFLGRLDDQVKLRGQRLELGEIESWLNRHPAIAQSAVRLWQQDHQNHSLVAYLVPRQQLPGKERITAFLKERLPDYMVPTLFVELEALPLTPNGKLDRRALPAPSFCGALEERVAPANDQQRLLHTLWAEVLGHTDFGITDNFFLVGGHSLAAARLSLLIGQRLGVGHQFPLSTIFRLPTIAEQENALLFASKDAVRKQITFEQSFTPDNRPNLAMLQPQGDKAPLFVVHGYRGAVGHFIHLARVLAPYRPVIGVQASEISDEMPPPASMERLADHYARQILAVRPEGVIHLVGCSAGGWYAYALAAALRQRGASIGLLAVFDTQATASIPFGLGIQLLLLHLVPRVKVHLARRFRPNGDDERHTSLRGRWQAVKTLANHYLPRYILGSQYKSASAEIRAQDPAIVGMRTGGDPFLALVRHGYSPPRLPISVDVFAPATNLPVLRRLWLHYARGGVHFHPLFNDHDDFIRPELMPQLAAALEAALARVEAGRSS